MNRFYHKLYRFEFQHKFYTDLNSADFKISPFAETSKWTQMNGLTIKTDEEGFDIIYRKKAELDTTPVIEIDEDKVLPFAIELRNSGILNLTDLPAKSDPNDLYICTGSYSDVSLTLTTIPTRQPQFTESYSYNFKYGRFVLEDLDGNTVLEQKQVGLEDADDPTLFNFSFSVNLDGLLDQGRYRLKMYDDATLEDDLEVYIFNRYEHHNLFAIFELELDSSIVFGGALYPSVLSFDAFESIWSYEIELTRTFTVATIKLTHSTAVSPVGFTMSPAVPTFVEGETITFTSLSAFTKTELPFTKLQLKLTSVEANFTLDKLPNPSHENQNSIVYLKI